MKIDGEYNHDVPRLNHELYENVEAKQCVWTLTTESSSSAHGRILSMVLPKSKALSWPCLFAKDNVNGPEMSVHDHDNVKEMVSRFYQTRNT